MFPRLNRGQKDLATYLMDRNGLMEGENRGGHEGKRATVLGEMVGLMARGTSRDLL